MRFLVLITFICIVSNAFAQKVDFNNYQTVKSSGEIPDDFLRWSFEKFEDDVSSVNFENKLSVRKSQKKFILKSTYLIDELLHSGLILFNDPVSIYINKIADVLLKDYPELRKEIRFYVSKSPAVNAFSTDKGIIFINMGLVAQVSTEAELALIMAHEIVHYQEKHNMNLYLEKERIFRGRQGYKYLNLNEKYLATNYWSKEIEEEADQKALTEFFSKTNYSFEAIDGVFDVLQYSYLPFDEIPFDFTFFETEHYQLPQKYILEDISSIKANDDYDDTKSTHPNTLKRRKSMKYYAENLQSKGKTNFILPEVEFYEVRKIARFETIRLMVIYGDFAPAIYNAYVMLKENHDNLFLQKCIIASLYSCHKYLSTSSISNVVDKYDKMEGESQPVYYLLREITEKDLNVLALFYAWKIRQTNPDDYYINLICDDLFNDLFAIQKVKVFDFSQNPKKTEADNFEKTIKSVDRTKLTKYDKIKLSQQKQDLKDEEWTRYAFVNYFTDTAFVRKISFFEKFAKKIKPDMISEQEYDFEYVENETDEKLSDEDYKEK